MLNDRKPSERWNGLRNNVGPEFAVCELLDELHATVTEHARALAGGARVDTFAYSADEHIRELTAALTAEQSAHEATRKQAEGCAREIEHLNALVETNAATIAQLTRERDEALGNYRFMVEKAADQKLDGYRELGERAAKAENERDELLRAAGINPGSNHEGAMAQLRDMRVSLKEAQANCDAAERGMRALLDSEGPGQALIGARVTQRPERCDAHDCIAPATHEIVNRGQHVAHFCDTHWLRIDARLGDIAALVKDGCHPEIAAARVGSGAADHGSNEDPLVRERESHAER